MLKVSEVIVQGEGMMGLAVTEREVQQAGGQQGQDLKMRIAQASQIRV